MEHPMRGIEPLRRVARWRWFPFVGLSAVALAFAGLAMALVPESLSPAGDDGDLEGRAGAPSTAARSGSRAAQSKSLRSSTRRAVRSPAKMLDDPSPDPDSEDQPSEEAEEDVAGDSP